MANLTLELDQKQACILMHVAGAYMEVVEQHPTNIQRLTPQGHQTLNQVMNKISDFLEDELGPDYMIKLN